MVLIAVMFASNLTRVSAGVYIAALAGITLFILAVADMLAEWKSKRWQFSLRTLLIGMMLLAVVLGIAVWASKYFPATH